MDFGLNLSAEMPVLLYLVMRTLYVTAIVNSLLGWECFSFVKLIYFLLFFVSSNYIQATLKREKGMKLYFPLGTYYIP